MVQKKGYVGGKMVALFIVLVFITIFFVMCISVSAGRMSRLEEEIFGYDECGEDSEEQEH